ncbi:DUF359 domain-containing protein [Pyrobaculum neutrophilum]|uniref:GTP-dependent dephospho-CoA kinase n=1 Tax=Pyrobaculum neutrophilum (strain DSM 2338 / JCM 9278 / NBRC 100436 / V24Sta) TaxID=444157 RepID=DPCKG_PYRNV|nr:DUF359 domain-containing protein [Pyrobaculum neutrophilum]B1Y9M7.1 RecName: Full=GTP-dependent dephospho-CoA kinase; AltName: Full=Dephospho-coenzyme A kinase; Short=DPCK [Pyrobaculum neutrophilum V24Sta]ACB40456.1 Protein of unknown function DUF359 [Pyrobaculum neutrophilum V24Sta]
MRCLRIRERRDLFAFPYPIAVWREPPRSLEVVSDLALSYGVEHIYTVGDVVTKNFLDYGVTPTSAAVDEKTRRGLPVEQHRKFQRVIKVVNPPGYITEEAWAAVEEAVGGGVLIKVEGEEDMLALAFIKMAPPRSLVVYGHYKGALIAVMVDWYRDAIDRLLQYLEKC